MNFEQALAKQAPTLARVRDANFWAALPSAPDFYAPDDQGAYLSENGPWQDGIAHYAKSDVDVATLRRAVARVEAAAFPGVFALVYDEVWQVLRSDALLRVVDELMPGAAQLPGIWLHRVPRTLGSHGWNPHVDTQGPMPGAPKNISLWLALTDAPIGGACIHAIPRSRTQKLSLDIETRTTLDADDFFAAVHQTRPLPLRASGIALWHPSVFHYGAAVTRPHSCDRVALSLEYGLGRPAKDHPFDPRQERTFDERLFLIGYALCAYARAKDREPYAARFVALGEALYKG